MTSRWATVLVTITAWMLLSNHCALGLSGTVVESDAEPDGCPMHSAPGEREAGDKSSVLQRFARGGFSRGETRHGSWRAQLVGIQNYVVAIFLPPPRLTARRCLPWRQVRRIPSVSRNRFCSGAFSLTRLPRVFLGV